MSKREPPPRGKLLVSAALTAGSLVACGAGEPDYQPPPGNPKGSQYDDTLSAVSAEPSADTPLVDPLPTAEPTSSATIATSGTAAVAPKPPATNVMPEPTAPRPPIAANTKGSRYDDGLNQPPLKKP